MREVRVVAKLIAKPDKIDELTVLLNSLVPITRNEPGCLQYDLINSLDNPCEFVFIEKWESKDALNVHLASDHIKDALVQSESLIASPVELKTYRVFHE